MVGRLGEACPVRAARIARAPVNGNLIVRARFYRQPRVPMAQPLFPCALLHGKARAWGRCTDMRPRPGTSRMAHASLKQALLHKVRRSKLLTCAAFMADNALATFGLIEADPSPSGHLSGEDIAADIAYARCVAADYVRYGEARGKAAEVGPGGSAAVALLMISQGCEEIDLVDRFGYPHNSAKLAATYRQIAKDEPNLRAVSEAGDPATVGIRQHVGELAAAETFFRSHGAYDGIFSCAVMEHLYDPIGALDTMVGALGPGGRMVHMIDFRDHGMFSEAGFHELEFFTIALPIYQMMSRRRGRPNRVLANKYAQVLAQRGLEHEVLVSHLVAVGPVEPARYVDLPAEQRSRAEAEVEAIRSRLSPPFRDLPVHELATSGIILTARKA